MAPTRKLAELFFDLRARTEGLSKDVDVAERQLGRLTSFVLRNPVTAILAVGTAAATASLQAVRMASEVDGAMRRVAASVPQGQTALQSLRDTVKSLSLETGKTQAELADTAAAIAREGASGAEEVATRLRAVVLASTASGEDMQAVLSGLDQALDLFGLQAAQSGEVLAELFSVAQGRTNLGALFDQLQKAAPVVQQLNLDLPTTARALVALGESGLSPKQAAAALKELAEKGADGRKEILALAASIPKADNPMQLLAASARTVADDAANAGARIKAELSATMIELGTTLLPLVTRGMRTFLEILNALRGGGPTTLGISDAFRNLAAGASAASKAAKGSKELFAANVQAGQSLGTLASAVKQNKDIFGQLGREGIEPVLAQLKTLREVSQGDPVQVRLIDEITAAAQRAKSAVEQIPPLSAGTGKSAAGPVKSPAEIKKESESAIKALQDLAGDADQVREQAIQRAQDQLKEVTQQAVADRIALAEALIQTGDATVATFAQLFDDITTQLEEEGKSAAEIPVLRNARLGIQSLRAELAELKTVTQDVLGKGLKELNAEVKQSDKERKDSAVNVQREADKALTRAQRVGRQIEDIGRLTIAAADAFGLLSDSARIALDAVVNVGAGIARIATGDLAGGLTQGLAGVITLAGQAFGKDPQAAQRQREHKENLARLDAIKKNTGDLVGLSATGNSIVTTTAGLEALMAQFERAGPRRELAVQALAPRALERSTGMSFQEIEALAKSLGITLNGTKQSYLDFLDALKSVDLAAFGEGFSGQLRQLEIETRLDPQAFEGLEGLIKRIGILTGPDGAPALAAALDGLDLSTSSGRAEAIERLSETLRNLKNLTPKDLGGLSLDQFIEEILATIEGLRAAEPAARTAGDKVREALDALAEAFEALDITDIETRTAKLAKVLAELVPAFAEVTDGLDTASLDSVEEADRRLRELFERRATLTEAERGGLSLQEFTAALLELDRALDASREKLTGQREKLAEQVKADEEARLKALSEAEQEAERERQRRVRERIQRARDESDALDDTPEQRLRRLVDALGELSPALGGVLEGLDLSSPEDLVELNARLEALFKTLGDDGVDAADLGGLSIAEFLEQLLAIEGDTDGLIAALAKLGAATQTVAEQINAALSLLDLDLAIAGITDPIERLQRTAQTIGGLEKRIGDALKGIDLSTSTGRAKAEQALQALAVGANADLKQLILNLLQQIRGVGADGAVSSSAEAAAASAGGGGGDAFSAQIDRLSEVTGLRMEGWLVQIAANTRRGADGLEALLSRLSSPAPLLVPPVLSSPLGLRDAGRPSLSVALNFYGDVIVRDANEFGRVISDRLRADLSATFALEARVDSRGRGEIEVLP